MRLRWVVPLLALAACDETVGGQRPVGGDTDSEAALQRFVRRATLDLAGHPPSETELADATSRLAAAGNAPSVRAALVDERLGQSEFGDVFIGELENGIFGGNSLEDQYELVCTLTRGNNPACDTCTSTDSCACQCDILPTYFAEREALRTTRADFMAGTASSTLERRYAEAIAYYVLAGEPEGRVRTLFDDFLMKIAEADELENGRSMINGALIPGSPAGLMFHRHGASYDDLLDILFESEVYREAIVRRVFNRYLAREPSAIELAHFVGTLDAEAPDARDLVRAVVSSREYFDQ